MESHEQKVQRFLEILPGALTWLVILFPVVGSFFIPRVVAYFILSFYVFWLYRSFKMAILGIRGYCDIRTSEQINWKARYERERKRGDLDWDEVFHVILIPNAGESVEKLSQNLDSLKNQTLDRKKLFVVLAMEERVSGSDEVARALLEKYNGVFGRLWVTFHPNNIPGEIVGKASNEAWAARQAKKKLLHEGFDLKMLTLTSCDADATFHPKYFEALTYFFATNPQRYRRFWQAPILGYNNLWRVPAPIRVVEVVGITLRLADLQDPSKLFFNYSCYSTSFSMVDEIGYWDTDIIPEDWHLFLQAFFALKGAVEVEPIFLPTAIDAPQARTYAKSLLNRYRQCKRHAWGVTDIPYAVKQFFQHPEIPFAARFFRIFKLFESHLLWPTNWFLITLGASIPPFLNPAFSQTCLGQNLPRMSQTIMTISLLGLGAIILLDAALRPPRPRDVSWWVVPTYYLQWLLLPVATFFMSSLPALESHTRLMWGRYLEYYVTEKA